MAGDRKVIGYDLDLEEIEFLLEGNVRETSEKVFLRMANQHKLDVEHFTEDGETKLRIPIYDSTATRVRETIVYPDVRTDLWSPGSSGSLIEWGKKLVKSLLD